MKRPQQSSDPDVYLVSGPSALTKTERGELVETVDWNDDGTPDWDSYSICDPYRGGGGPRGFAALAHALEFAEENYERVFDEQPSRIPD